MDPSDKNLCGTNLCYWRLTRIIRINTTRAEKMSLYGIISPSYRFIKLTCSLPSAVVSYRWMIWVQSSMLGLSAPGGTCMISSISPWSWSHTYIHNLQSCHTVHRISVKVATATGVNLTRHRLRVCLWTMESASKPHLCRGNLRINMTPIICLIHAFL